MKAFLLIFYFLISFSDVGENYEITFGEPVCLAHSGRLSLFGSLLTLRKTLIHKVINGRGHGGGEVATKPPSV